MTQAQVKVKNVDGVRGKRHKSKSAEDVPAQPEETNRQSADDQN